MNKSLLEDFLDALEEFSDEFVLKQAAAVARLEVIGRDVKYYSRWIRELERAEKLERRLAARERELERIRNTMYRNRVDEFERVKKGS